MERNDVIYEDLTKAQCYAKIVFFVNEYYNTHQFEDEGDKEEFKFCIDCLPKPGSESSDERMEVALAALTGVFERRGLYDKTVAYARRILEKYDWNCHNETVERLKQKGSKVVAIVYEVLAERRRTKRIAEMKEQGKKCYSVYYYSKAYDNKITRKVYASSEYEANQIVYENGKNRVLYVTELPEDKWE